MAKEEKQEKEAQAEQLEDVIEEVEEEEAEVLEAEPSESIFSRVGKRALAGEASGGFGLPRAEEIYGFGFLQ